MDGGPAPSPVRAAARRGLAEFQDRLPRDVADMAARVRELHGDQAFAQALDAGMVILRQTDLLQAGGFDALLARYNPGAKAADRTVRRVVALPRTLDEIIEVARDTGLPRWKVTTAAFHFARTCKMGTAIAREFPFRSARGR